MDLKDLISRWLVEKHPDIQIDRSVVCLPIKSKHTTENDVWYVCKVEEDRIFLFSPAKQVFGEHLLAGLPTFFEQFDAIITYYRSYAA